MGMALSLFFKKNVSIVKNQIFNEFFKPQRGTEKIVTHPT